MKKIIAGIILAAFVSITTLGFASSAYAKTVKGYTTKKGTYVAPYHRTTADSKKSNNYSSKGNINPYTGKKGYK
jgi:hypothetical protein